MKSDYTLRPYQENAVAFVEEQMNNKDTTSAIIVRPTGTGKTIIMSSIIEKELEHGGRVLLLAHRNKLLEQAHDKLFYSCGIDASYEGTKEDIGDDRVIICSIQSMSRENRLSSYSNDFFTMILVDETHHISSPSYQKVVDYFSNAKLIGVTATPVRSDGTDTTELFDKVAPAYTTREAIEDGFLSPFRIQKALLNIDISKVHMQCGDYSTQELGNVLNKYLKKIAKVVSETASDKKIVIFVPLVSTAQKLSSIFNETTSLKAEYVAGARKDSDEILDKFEAGEYNVICNSMLLTEGWDCPSVDCVINLRPTKSKGLYTQIIGRGLRLSPGKSHALILDFLWNDNGRGHLNAQDVFIDPEDEFEKQAMDDVLQATGEAIDVRQLKSLATNRAEQLREAALVEAIELANNVNRLQEEQIRQHKELVKSLFKFAYHKFTQTGEPLEKINAIAHPAENIAVRYNCVSAMILSVKITDAVLDIMGLGFYKYSGAFWEQEPVSSGQIRFAEQMGFPSKYLICKGQASYIIDEITKRKANGYASYKQIECLLKMNIPVNKTTTSKEAGSYLNQRSHKNKPKIKPATIYVVS